MSNADGLKEVIQKRVFLRAKDGHRMVSGEKKQEWIFDFRAIMLEPRWLDAYAEIFWERFKDMLPFQIGGVESAAIPLITAIVMKSVARGTPVNGFYIRKSRKREGLMKAVEGTLTDEPIILVDDLINSGGSFDRQLKILREGGKDILAIFTMLRFREDEAYSALTTDGTALHSLFTLKDFGIPLVSAQSPAVPREAFKTVWKFAGRDPGLHVVVQKSSPVIDGERVYFGSDDGYFRALDRATGALSWEYAIGKHPLGKAILSSPALHGGIVYFGAYDGAVYALDSKTGKKIWSYEEADWVGSSPTLAPDLGLLFIGLEFGLFRKRGGIVAIDMKTGAAKWQDKTPSLTHGSPLYIREEQMVVIGSNDGAMYAYDASSGEMRWRYQCGADIKMRPAYDAKRRLVLFGSMDTKLYALEAKSGIPVFAFPTGGGIYSTPLIDGNLVYIASLDKSVYAVDLQNGKQWAEFETNGRIFASPALFDDAIWTGSNDGRLYELARSTLKIKGFFQATERIVGMPTFDAKSKHIYFCTVANDLYCIERSDAARPQT